jgi:hypothetical protein
VKEARDILLDLHATFIIGTTMSHQISKNGEPPRDRFRIIVEMDRPCLNPDMFRENVMSWIKIFGGDPVAKDAARLFRPCKVIYSKQDLAQPWIPLPPNYYERKKKQHETQSESIRYHLARRSIPDWILRAQKFGVPKGGGAVKGRHHACFKIGATMTELGYSVDEIVGFLLAGLINKEGDVNVRRQVECGANAALSRIVSPKQQLHEDDFELLHGGQPQREGN